MTAPRAVAQRIRGNRVVSRRRRPNHLIKRPFFRPFRIVGNKFNPVEIACRSRDHRAKTISGRCDMAKMRAIDGAVRILEKEGVTTAFGVPGAAINPLYSALKRRGSIRHILARHVEGASHMAEGYTRARCGNIGVCIGTSGPAGTDMITGLYSAIADSIPILCITGQAPRARLYKEDFQAIDIESIAKPVTKWAVTVREPGLVPRVFSQAFHLMRSGRPGPVLIDLPLDVQLAEIEFDDETYSPLPVYKPSATRAQVERALEMLNAAERPLIVAGGGVINADASELLVTFAETVNVPVVPTLMGWGAIPDDHVLMAGMVGLQTSHRYGNATLLQSDFVLGIGNRWANRHTGSVETYTKGRTFVHVDIEPTQIGRVFNPDLGIVSDAKAALELFVTVAREWRKAGKLKDRQAWPASCQDRKRTMLRKSHFDDMPIKPQRVYQEMNKTFGRDTCYVTVIGLSQIAGAQFLRVYNPRNWINAGQAGPLGWTLPAALGVRAADPSREIVALSGDYDFQFLIEELAVGAQFKLPYIHVVVNNSYLGLIRQAQRGFEMDYQVQLSFENINAPEIGGYGVDHVAVAEGLGCKAIRVTDPNHAQAAFETARQWMAEYQVPVVVEFILERVTNISMGTEIDNVVEFEEILDLPLDDTPVRIEARQRGTLLPAE
jgi:tartronate-semialdehyde synthase